MKILVLTLFSTLAWLLQSGAAQHNSDRNEESLLLEQSWKPIQFRISSLTEKILKTEIQLQPAGQPVSKLRRRRDNEEAANTEAVTPSDSGTSIPDPNQLGGINPPPPMTITLPPIPNTDDAKMPTMLPPPASLVPKAEIPLTPSLDNVPSNNFQNQGSDSSGSSFLPSMESAKQTLDNMSKQAKEISTNVANAIGEFVNSVTGVFNNAIKG